jgi:hypothetical protein
MNFVRERLTMGMEAPLKLGSCITLPANIRKGWKEQLSSKCKALIQTPVLPKRGRGRQMEIVFFVNFIDFVESGIISLKVGTFYIVCTVPINWALPL